MEHSVVVVNSSEIVTAMEPNALNENAADDILNAKCCAQKNESFYSGGILSQW